MDKISIIVPVLNSKEHLNRIIMGLLKQTINDMEIIIVDSGSSDSTLDMCKDWSFLDNRIKVYETKDSVIDFGLKKATGKYILFLDNLNINDNTMLEKMQKALIQNNADISIYNSNYSIITNYLVCDSINIINDFDGCLWNKLFKKNLFNSYNNIEDVFKTALKKAVRISLFV